MKKTEDLRTTT